MTDDPTVDTAIGRALDAYDALAEQGEEIEDEWTYVTDLAAAWRDRLEAVAAARGGDSIDAAVDAAIGLAIDEIARIDDPHRAIDWLSKSVVLPAGANVRTRTEPKVAPTGGALPQDVVTDADALRDADADADTDAAADDRRDAAE